MRIEDKIRDICSRLGEQFPEYVIVVKTENGKIAFKFSEATWAMGALQRVGSYLDGAQDVISAGDDDEGRAN